jgi:hypothetical protein
MNDNDPKLLEGLRELAADGPREAPVFVEERLVGELQRRSRVRLRNRWMGVGVAAIAAGLALMVWARLEPAGPAPTMARLGGPVASTPVKQASVPVLPQASPQSGELAINEVAINFYRLPDADDLPPIESATIVRVQLPMSSLRLIGLPVSEDRAAELVQADMLLGQDGLARGVRLVQ